MLSVLVWTAKKGSVMDQAAIDAVVSNAGQLYLMGFTVGIILRLLLRTGE